jgi:hypothetical protein
MKTKKCTCNFCRTYARYKWAVVTECKCLCHKGDGMTDHDGLCCSISNGLAKNNPYKKLKSAEYYKKKLDKMEYGE